MNIFDIIRADKTNLNLGSWKSGKIPHSVFPLSRGSLQLGRGWEWRNVTFDALGRSFRVLVGISEEKEFYRAMLAMDDEKLLKVICHHELHTTHWNWHCHLYTGDVNDIYPGVLRDKEKFIPWPAFSQDECSVGFNLDKASALTKAAVRFRFQAQGGFL